MNAARLSCMFFHEENDISRQRQVVTLPYRDLSREKRYFNASHCVCLELVCVCFILRLVLKAKQSIRRRIDADSCAQEECTYAIVQTRYLDTQLPLQPGVAT